MMAVNRFNLFGMSPDSLRHFYNLLWMFSEQSLKIVSAIFVGVYVARYLGPRDFGILSYAVAIVTFFMAFTRLGMESILVRELVVNPYQYKRYMGTAFFLMLLGGIFGILFIALIVNFIEQSAQIKLCISIISMGLIFQAFLVVDYRFQSEIRAKYSSIAKSISLALGALLKIILVHIQAPLVYFALAYMADFIFLAVCLLSVNFLQGNSVFFFSGSIGLVRPLLRGAWPLVLSALAINLYTNVDKIMIKSMLGEEQLGLYAAAVKIYDGIVILPWIVGISLLPYMTKIRSGSVDKYKKSFARLFAFVFWLGISAAIVVYFIGESIIQMTFGREYSGSHSVLVITTWAVAFAAIGHITSRYFTVEKKENKIFIRTFSALIINVCLNFFLIPAYGIEGAAWATLISLIFSGYIIDYFDSGASELLEIKNMAFLFRII